MLENILQTLLSEVQKISRAETVVGEAIAIGSATLVPICRVQIGFGVGSSGIGGANPSKFSGTGSGGGIRIDPVACVVVDQSGRVQLLSLSDPATTTVGKIIDLVPEVLNRLGLDVTGEKKDAANSEASPKQPNKTAADKK